MHRWVLRIRSPHWHGNTGSRDCRSNFATRRGIRISFQAMAATTPCLDRKGPGQHSLTFRGDRKRGVAHHSSSGNPWDLSHASLHRVDPRNGNNGGDNRDHLPGRLTCLPARGIGPSNPLGNSSFGCAVPIGCTAQTARTAHTGGRR